MFVFFFNAPATTEIYSLSLHDALPISGKSRPWSSSTYIPVLSACSQATGATGSSYRRALSNQTPRPPRRWMLQAEVTGRSEEHTSELQSQSNLVCRLLLEKKSISLYVLPPVEDAEAIFPVRSNLTAPPDPCRSLSVIINFLSALPLSSAAFAF